MGRGSATTDGPAQAGTPRLCERLWMPSASRPPTPKSLFSIRQFELKLLAHSDLLHHTPACFHTASTHQYVEADLAMKERALARLREPEARIRRYRAPDSLISFLKML
jgi:hypothetical protein